MADSDFWVLLGTDYCGKSSVLADLAARDGHVRPTSYDPTMLTGDYRAIAELPAALGKAFAGQNSPDYVMALLNVAVAYLRDSVFTAPQDRTPLLDSYYYKILVKCRLLGLPDEPWQEYWRSLPRPSGVVFLDVAADTAWQRSGAGALLNPLEHYGPTPGKESFTRFQGDLRAGLIDAVKDLRVEHISAGQDIAATTDHVLRAMKE
ncbi:hypothetical protein ACFQ0X_27765 [Streptomyces rectiviolaceus]|uniref:Thymidylate kinase n=1 Tax=Streptomyces rectiviolaceus TaxID=332591 RepID=A0ABP6MBG6_9ACTN